MASKSWGGRRYMPYAFTEQGVAMLSTVLNSERAIRVNIEIMRAFVRMRGLVITYRELAEKMGKLEQRYDSQFRVVFDAIRELILNRRPPSEIYSAAQNGGTVLLRETALTKARTGVTTVTEINRVTFAE